jgi:hypothetical protein
MQGRNRWPERKFMADNNYYNLFFAAGISDRSDQEQYSRRLDMVIASEGITLDDIFGVGEEGTGSNCDLYVVHRQGITLACEKGVFNKRIEVRLLCPIASIANLKGAQEGFKGSEIIITGTSAQGEVVLKIVWRIGGGDWSESVAQHQSEHLFRLIGEAMDKLADPPARPSVSSASSKTGALMDWAADVVKTSGVQTTAERVEEHANMIAGVIRFLVFLPLGKLESLDDFYPSGEMPAGTPIETFDDLYKHVVARVGSAQPVDQGIDEYLAGCWNEYVRGCHETYS